MLAHWRRESKRKGLPKWSSINESKKGFKFYWFDIDKDIVSQSCADRCENLLANRLIEEIHVGNGKFVGGKENNYDVMKTADNSTKKILIIKLKSFLKNQYYLNWKR